MIDISTIIGGVTVDPLMHVNMTDTPLNRIIAEYAQ
jgi:hypothetical protein